MLPYLTIVTFNLLPLNLAWLSAIFWPYLSIFLANYFKFVLLYFVKYQICMSMNILLIKQNQYPSNSFLITFSWVSSSFWIKMAIHFILLHAPVFLNRPSRPNSASDLCGIAAWPRTLICKGLITFWNNLIPSHTMAMMMSNGRAMMKYTVTAKLRFANHAWAWAVLAYRRAADRAICSLRSCSANV